MMAGMLCLMPGMRTMAQVPLKDPAEVPVLCYHQIRDYTAKDNASTRSYTVTPARFAAHMKMLADSGYHPILPDRLYEHYTTGRALPSKPVIITFDDNTLSQYTNALPILNKYGFKAVFFVMTVSINRPFYMSRDQLKALHDQGHVLGCHTWDHHDVRKYGDGDWKIQLDKPFATLQQITGEPVTYFAYPFGVWSQQAIDELQKRGIRMAFILHTPFDEKRPLFTQRRQLVVGSMSAATLAARIKKTF